MTLGQSKAFNALLFHVQDEMKQGNMYNEFFISTAKLRALMGGTSNQLRFNNLRDDLSAISNVKLQTNITNKDGSGSWGEISIIADTSVPYEADGNFNVLAFRLGPSFWDIVKKGTAIYGKINLKISREFKSKYSHALYQLLVDCYRDFTFTIEDLKEILGCAMKYPKFTHFKLRCLDPALEDINNVTPLNASYVQVKTGRKVTHVTFAISKKPEIRVIGENEDHVTYDALCRVGFDDVATCNIISKYSTDEIFVAITYVEGKGELENKCGYVLDALKKGYAMEEQQMLKAAAMKALTLEDQNEYESYVKVFQKKCFEAYNSRMRVRVKEFWDKLPKKQQEEYQEKFSGTLFEFSVVLNTKNIFDDFYEVAFSDMPKTVEEFYEKSLAKKQWNPETKKLEDK